MMNMLIVIRVYKLLVNVIVAVALILLYSVKGFVVAYSVVVDKKQIDFADEEFKCFEEEAELIRLDLNNLGVRTIKGYGGVANVKDAINNSYEADFEEDEE